MAGVVQAVAIGSAVETKKRARVASQDDAEAQPPKKRAKVSPSHSDALNDTPLECPSQEATSDDDNASYGSSEDEDDEDEDSADTDDPDAAEGDAPEDRDSEQETIECSGCSKVEDFGVCVTCDRCEDDESVCEDCVLTCESCGFAACVKCAVQCVGCDDKEKKHCEKSCAVSCSAPKCRNSCCKEHRSSCAECERVVCAACVGSATCIGVRCSAVVTRCNACAAPEGEKLPALCRACFTAHSSLSVRVLIGHPARSHAVSCRPAGSSRTGRCGPHTRMRIRR